MHWNDCNHWTREFTSLQRSAGKSRSSFSLVKAFKITLGLYAIGFTASIRALQRVTDILCKEIFAVPCKIFHRAGLELNKLYSCWTFPKKLFINTQDSAACTPQRFGLCALHGKNIAWEFFVKLLLVLPCKFLPYSIHCRILDLYSFGGRHLAPPVLYISILQCHVPSSFRNPPSSKIALLSPKHSLHSDVNTSG